MVLAEHLPPESATARAIDARNAWSVTDHLLAAAVDLLAAANWQRAGDRHAKRPPPIPRPGVDAPSEVRRLGTPLPLDQLRAALARHRSPEGR